MIIDTKVVTDFEELQKKIPRIIEVYGTEKKSLYGHIGISKSTLNRKIKNRSFTIKEMYQLAEYYNSLQDKLI